MLQTPGWNRDALLKSPLFSPLCAVIARCGEDFPALEECNALLAAQPVTVQSGAALRFVAQEYGRLPFEAQYEPRCYLRGEVQTREQNWHDLLNAMVWLTFPRAKAAINARHYHALLAGKGQGSSQRGAVRDMNTLFDESGLVVACADAELAALLRNFKWQELFWDRRERVKGSMDFCLFGHGLYEKAMRPYIGLTGQGLLLEVGQEYSGWTQARQLAHLDGLLAEYLADARHCLNTRELTPVPLLGVPGWVVENESADFYSDTRYFRPGRRSREG